MKSKHYTEAEVKRMKKLFVEIQKMVHSTDEVIRSNKKTLNGNVIYTDFKLIKEFRELIEKDTELSVIKMLEKYKNWSERAFFIAYVNSGKSNKKLLSHILQCRDAVATISKIIPV